MRLKGFVAPLAAAAVIVGYGTAAGDDVEPALSSGDTVTFLVPAGISFTIGEADAVAHVTGQVSGTTQITGCVADTDQHPIQRIVVVDPGSGVHAFQFDIVPVDQTTPIHPGTQLTNLTLLNSCTVPATGAQYDEYSGTVP